MIQNKDNFTQGVTRRLAIGACLFLTFCSEVTNGFKNIEFSIYGNWIGFTLLFIILLKNIPKARFLIFIVVAITVIYAILRPSNMFTGLDSIKWTLYVILAILLGVEFSKNDLSDTIEKTFFLYITLTLILFIFGIGVDADFFSGRIQGLTSEPSALALIITYLFWQLYYKKRYSKLLIVLIVAILTFSLTVYACMLLYVVVRKIIQLRRLGDYIKVAIFMLVGIYGLLTISELSFENPLADKVVDVAIHTITLGERGRNTRAIDADLFFDAQYQDEYSYWIGNGPSSSVAYYKNNETLAVAKNLPTSILFDFGVVGTAVFFFIIIACLKKIRISPYSGLFIAAFTYSMINGAAGFVNDIYLYALLSFCFIGKRVMKITLPSSLKPNIEDFDEKKG